MHAAEYPSWLVDLEPQLPLNSLVYEINNLFHFFDAAGYDAAHPEIFEQLPAVWDEMIQQLPARQAWSILDFGCGTGFEAAQIIRCLQGRVAQLVCFDPSPEMMARCKKRIDKTCALFFTKLEDALHHGPFDLLLTNSLLHHLTNIPQAISTLLPALAADAMWLAGHEPSSRFYLNSNCLRFLDEYSRYQRWAKLLNPRAYIAKARVIAGRDPLRATAHAAWRRGLFKKRPSPRVIDRIVDFHVPHSSEEVAQGRGLDFERMKTEFSSDWSLKWVRTYSFFGSLSTAGAPQRWVERSHELAAKFPLDGANFAMVWSRTRSGSSN
jgi:SAM-dependent methyltransferase